MKVTILLFVLPLLTGVCSLRLTTLYIRAGEMVALRCPQKKDANTNILWTNQTSGLSSQSSDFGHKDVLLQGHSLVILRASVSHQGNYSCSAGNASSQSWFSLILYDQHSKDYEERNQYSTTCYTKQSCTMYCPAANIPANDNPQITRSGITWYKEGETLPTTNTFQSVLEKDGGIYRCIRSFLYDSEIYNMSFTVILEIKPSKYGKSEIISPRQNVFHIDLGSTVVIECRAVTYSDFDEVFWLSGNSFIESDESLPVFYNYTRTQHIDEINITVSLVFRKVSEEELLKKYTCKLESDHQKSSFITISLAENGTSARPVLFFPVFVVFCTLALLLW